MANCGWQSNLTKLTGKTLDSRLEDAQRKNNDNDNKQLLVLGAMRAKLDENSRQLDVQGTNTSRLVERLCIPPVPKVTEWTADTRSRNYFFTLGADLKSFMSRIWTLNFKMYSAIVDLQSRIPESKPCWVQEPLILTDALGRVAPIHLELVNSRDVFDYVIAARFIDLPGEGKVARGEYAIHELNLVRDLDRTQPFAACFMPGLHLDMMMAFRNENDLTPSNSCPGCKTASEKGSSSTTQWFVTHLTTVWLC